MLMQNFISGNYIRYIDSMMKNDLEDDDRRLIATCYDRYDSEEWEGGGRSFPLLTTQLDNLTTLYTMFYCTPPSHSWMLMLDINKAFTGGIKIPFFFSRINGRSTISFSRTYLVSSRQKNNFLWKNGAQKWKLYVTLSLHQSFYKTAT
jgi:hypothetical protein